MKEPLQKPTTPIQKGLRTALQAGVGVLIGLATTVWAVPGVPEAVQTYLTGHVLQLVITVGAPAGLFAWLQNRAGK